MHDSPFPLRRLINPRRGKRKAHPNYVLVAVNLKKAYDTVTYEAIIDGLQEAYPRRRKLRNFVKSFLEHRMFEIRSESKTPRLFLSITRVPQGTIISPFLFNVVMRGLVKEIQEKTEVCLTIYIDDISLWTEATDFPDMDSIVEVMQEALDIMEAYLHHTGMSISKLEREDPISPHWRHE